MELDLEEYATYTLVNSKISVHKITIIALLQEVALVVIMESDCLLSMVLTNFNAIDAFMMLFIDAFIMLLMLFGPFYTVEA